MLNLFELAAKITLDKKDFESGLKDSESRMSKFGAGMSKAFKATVAIGGAAAAAGAAAFGKIVKSALDAEGELEQGLGGAEAVFGKWAEHVKAKANEAAAAAGISANEYLATANKMGSLLQGVGYSEMDAADLATDAIQRAADVASIMGIDVSAALESVTGAMKGNFTMMDNLGVAINDTTLKAYAATKGWKKEAIDNMSTQAKVGLALEMFTEKTEKYAGNYAEENKTLAGSLTTLKAAWANFLSGAGENAPEILGQSIENTADIVVKKMGTIVPRVASGLNVALKKVGAKLPELMKTLTPGIEQGVSSLLDLLGDALPYLLQTAVNLVPSVVSGLGKVFVKVGQKAPEMLKGLLDGIKNAGNQIGGMIFGTDAKGAVKWPTWDDVKGYAIAAWAGIKKGAVAIADWAGGLVFGRDKEGKVNWPSWGDVLDAAKKAWSGIKRGAAGIMHEAGRLVFGEDDKGEVKWPTWKEVGEKAAEIWEDIKRGAATLTGLVFGDGAGIENFKDALESIKTKWNELKTTIKENAIDFLSGFTGKKPEEIEPILDGIAKGLTAIGVAIAIYKLGTTLTTVFSAITGFFASGLTVQHPVLLAISALAAAGVLIYENWDGISEFFSNLWQGITEWATDAYDTVKKWWEEDIVAPIKEKWDAIVEKIQDVVEDVKSAWNVIVEWFTTNIIDPIKGTWDEITTTVQSVEAAVEGVWSAIVGFFRDNIIGPIIALWESVTGAISGTIEKAEEAKKLAQEVLNDNSLNEAPSSQKDISVEQVYDTSPRNWAPSYMGGAYNAKGLGYVPYDGYRSILHRGEMILNKSRADDYRKGDGRNSIAEMTQAIVAAVRAGMNGVNYNFSLDGERVAQNTSSRQAEDDMAWRFAVG